MASVHRLGHAANFLADRYHLMITLRAMIEPTRDRGLDDLLILDDTVLVVDPVGNHWVKFVVKQVAPSPERPHGIRYALTLHGADGERLVGYDNAHPVSAGRGPARRTSPTHDHRHRHGVTTPYAYRDAATLIQDFWNDVVAVLRERGVAP
jgi:hypothetical protein